MVTDTDYTSYFRQLNSILGHEYNNYFSKELPWCKNSLISDVSLISPFSNLELMTYRKKQFIIEPIIKTILDDSHCKNWGIIRTEYKQRDGSLYDSIDANRSMVLVAFDIEGFNMPFRFHVSKDSLTDIVCLSTNDYLVPEYQGADDFTIGNDVIPSNIIMPIPKRNKSIIMENAKKEDGNNKNFWEHLYFLTNGTFPKHLTQPITAKNQVRYTRLPITYTNLNTGKRYVKNNNQFIEVDDSYAR